MNHAGKEEATATAENQPSINSSIGKTSSRVRQSCPRSECETQPVVNG